jgi:hypothetical protein
MPTTIKLKNSVTTTNAPSSLEQGEVAINVTDKKVWVGNAATTPVQIAGAGAGGGAAAGSDTQVQYNSSGALAGDADFTFNGTILTVPAIADAQGGVLAPISSVMRNRIINGAMVIDQRNAGASLTANNTVFAVDRFRTYMSQSSKGTIQQNAGAVTPPAGFTNYLGFTSTSAYSVLSSDHFVITQYIEGFNAADLNWGTANAKTVTLSFWVRSSLTGTFGGSVQNSAFNRSYPFTYTISAANTWEQKSVTIAGDTSGTWVGATNGVGMRVGFGLGVGSTLSGTAGAWAGSNFDSATGATSVVGTNGATFYITGVQLEVGTQATSFEYRQYTTELQLCQRYLPMFRLAAGDKFVVGQAISASVVVANLPFLVSARTAPTGITASAGSSFALADAGLNYGANQTGTAIAFETGQTDSGSVRFTCTSGLVAGNASTILSRFANTTIQFTGCEL